ncbi:GH32 C-terminal domain-containing protein [Phocaeicola faecicola]|uniref:GH32 C-terminal domain-containing protein n=1 Tax=Phocaeicola faecicola TaxID=2739389 RepID=UPI002A80D1D3|nr:GH32 C-terminal domain-containing protein [Phocaeicola faecicola]MDY4777802.1 GH32 C-terminal domain-containing protein [Phocaeicola vulgatus]MDY4871636.1 GH32 C-terminal domain-containing protein [Phocaeicola faecicola]
MNVMGESLGISHLVSEQNIVTIKKTTSNYLLLPIQDNAPEAKVYIVKDGLQMNVAVNVRLAREHIDYYVPLNLLEYQGKDIAIDILGMPANALCWDSLKLSNVFDMTNFEKFRPVYHHTPAYGWMNDPNGMFYKDGVYHLYYQYNPYGSVWGNMTWGHSTSRDLVHWTYEGTPIVPDAWGAIFSGSCVVDHENTAGFGKGAVVAFYTSAKSTPWGDVQSQSMAYSLDNGKTFTKYEGNPILTSSERDFRDPKVFWYAPGKHWVMMLAVGQHMEIYSSVNLKDWKKESEFGAMQGAHGGVWECPDLVEIPVEGTRQKKWVLICNLNPGGPFGGSAAQYFVGSFDGKTFVNESPTLTKWMDWGKDNYATVTWNNAPDGRCVALGWMSNWQYANNVPTRQYRSANTIARDLTLYRVGEELYLKSTPSPEVKKARGEKVSKPSFNVAGEYELASLLDDNKGAYEVELVIQNQGASKIAFCLLNEKGEKVSMYYDLARRQFVMDRSESGTVDFSKDFPAVTVAPADTDKELTLRLFVDRSSIEAFGEDGKFVMTNLVFPSLPYNKMCFTSDEKGYTVKSFKVYRLQ